MSVNRNLVWWHPSQYSCSTGRKGRSCMSSGIYEESSEHVLRTISVILGRSEIDNLVGLKTMVENKEIPAEEMHIYTSSKNILPKPGSPGKLWEVVHLSQVPFTQKLAKHGAGEESAEKVTTCNFTTKMDVTKHTFRMKCSNTVYHLRLNSHVPLLQKLSYPFPSIQIPFLSQRKYHPLATQGRTRTTFTVLSFPPRWNSLSFLVFLLLPKSSPHTLTTLAYLLCLSPFLWFLSHSRSHLLLFSPLTSHLTW